MNKRLWVHWSHSLPEQGKGWHPPTQTPQKVASTQNYPLNTKLCII